MNSRSTPPRFQIHLSTLLSISLMCGAVLWLQTSFWPREIEQIECGDGNTYYRIWEGNGFPLPLRGRYVHLNRVTDGPPKFSQRSYEAPMHAWGDPSDNSLGFSAVVDGATSLAVIYLIARFLERRIQKQRNAKTQSQRDEHS